MKNQYTGIRRGSKILKERTMKIADTIEPTPADFAQRTCIRQYNGDGMLVVRTYGPSIAELKEAHENGTCDMWCEYCYTEAMNTLCAKDPDTCDSIPPGSCGPDCHGFERKYK